MNPAPPIIEDAPKGAQPDADAASDPSFDPLPISPAMLAKPRQPGCLFVSRRRDFRGMAA
jgi:hypothetical protein